MERLKIVGEIILEEKGCFTVNHISKKTGLSAPDVRAVLDRLFREGLLLRIKTAPKLATLRGRPPSKLLYQKKNKKEFTKKISPQLKENTASDRMWSIIRARGSFTIQDLIVLAEVGRENARWFVKMLRRAGIVRNVGYRNWALVKDPGPTRPYVSSKQEAVSSKQ